MKQLSLFARCGGLAVCGAVVWRVLLLATTSGCGPMPPEPPDLTGDEEVPPVTTQGMGTGTYSLNADTTELTYSIEAFHLSGRVTAAHFHNAPSGENGDIVFDLTEFITEQNDIVLIEGQTQLSNWTLNDPAAELLAGNIYVNLHTEMHPSGELRGQVVSPCPEYSAPTGLCGFNEVPPVLTSGSGSAYYTLNADRTELSFSLDWFNLSGAVTAAHFHNASPGLNGEIVFDLAEHFAEDLTQVIQNDAVLRANVSGTTRLVDWAMDNALEQLLAGNIYVNLHTEMHPAGEVRGLVQAVEQQETLE